MNKPSEMAFLLYSMSAETAPGYNQPQTRKNIEDSSIYWRTNFAGDSLYELFDRAVQCTRENMADMS